MMKKIYFFSLAICAAAFTGLAQNAQLIATQHPANPQRSFKPTIVNQNDATILLNDTLHYFFNKNYYRNTPAASLQFWTIKSPLTSTQNVTHCGAVFLNSTVTTVHGLEALVMRNPASTSPTIGVTLYLCNANGANVPQFPPLDSVLTTVSTSTAGVWVGGNFTNPVMVTGKFAVLFKRTLGVPGDTAILFMNNAATATSTVPAAQKYGEGLGVLRFNGNFQNTTNAFGTGTDYEFIVAPRVSYNITAGAQVLTPTICTNSNGSFSSTSTPPGIIEHRQFNFNKFAAHWKAVAPGTNSLMTQVAPDSIFNWTFTGSPSGTSFAKNPVAFFNQVGIQNANLTVKYKPSTFGGVYPSVNDVALANIDVQPSSGPTITVGGNTLICQGSTATLTASGSISYTWSNNSQNPSISVSPNVSTTYTVSSGSGGGCAVSSETIMVSVSQVPTVAITGGSAACVGAAAISLSVSGASSFTWSNGSNATSISASTGTPGVFTYSVEGENAPCAPTSDSKIITINAKPDVSLTSAQPTLCTKTTGGSTIQLTGTPAGGNYFGAGVSSGGIFTPNTAGSFTLTYSYQDPATTCQNTGSVAVQVLSCSVDPSSVNSQKLNANLVVFPNPTVKGIVNLRNLEGPNGVTIYNLLGDVVASTITDKSEYSIDLSSFAEGCYFIRVTDVTGNSRVLKIVNQN